MGQLTSDLTFCCLTASHLGWEAPVTLQEASASSHDAGMLSDPPE